MGWLLIGAAWCGFGMQGALAASDNATPAEPQYGGTLDIVTVHASLSALSWNPVDWSWKANHDAGLVREHLWAADLEKSQHKGGPYLFVNEAYIPPDAVRGELAESWEWTDPRTLVVRLREDARFPDKPGVMASRLMTADDVVFTFNLINGSPKKSVSDYFDYIDSVEARDDRTVVFNLNEFNAEWQYRFGYGYQSSIVPRETAGVDANDWRNVVGTGPFELARYIQGNRHTYVRRPDYWGEEVIGGKPWPIPFVDTINYRIIKDEATQLTALRTGQIDILESIRWIAVDHLKESTPELEWSRWLSTAGSFVALRLDHPPFRDRRVRRAMNLAVNQQEIVDKFYGGHAELMAYPQHPGFGEYFQPLEEMPPSVRELFGYDPDKARALLAEAGYADGFTFRMQVCSCSPNNMDLVPLLGSYLEKVGIRIEIEPLEYASFLSAMTTRTHAPGYLMNSGHVNPIATLRKFSRDHTWNPSLYDNPAFDEAVRELARTRDEAERVLSAHRLTADLLDEAPYIWLPIQYNYTAWWPWVKNYGGDLRAGAVRPGPIYTRIWIDQTLKRQLGF